MPMTHVPEMMLTPDESKVLDEVMLESPGNKYAFGYNASQGDNGTVQSKMVSGLCASIYFFYLFQLAGSRLRNKWASGISEHKFFFFLR